MGKVTMDKKIALYINDEQITEYKYSWGKEAYGIICMGCDDGTVDIYDGQSGKLNSKLFGVIDVVIEKYFILATMFNTCIRVFDFNSKILIGTAYKSIKVKGDYLIAKNLDDYVTVYKRESNNHMEVIMYSFLHIKDVRFAKEGIITHKYLCDTRYIGLYSYKGEEILPCIYSNITFRKNDIIVVTHDGFKGVYSYLGDVIIPTIIPVNCKEIKMYHNLYVVTTGKKGKQYYGLYTNNGKKILSARYDNYRVTSPYIYLSLNGLSCVYDLITGKRILPLKFKDISVYYNVFVTKEADKKFSIYSAENGKKLTDEFYDNIKIYDQGILLLETIYGKKMFYLTEHDAFVNANTNDVYYNKDNKQVYIKDIIANEYGGNLWKPYIKEC